MDSIERMRKINDLTKELKQHGFAESSFEAIQQANQIYGDDDVSQKVKDGLIETSPHERIAGTSDADGAASIHTDRKITKLTENIDQLTSKINEIVRAINDIDSRINGVKSRQEEILSKVSQAQREAREPMPEHRPESRPTSEAKTDSGIEESKGTVQGQKKDEYSTNQRTGNFQSQDVAIDKMFYFGNKK